MGIKPFKYVFKIYCTVISFRILFTLSRLSLLNLKPVSKYSNELPQKSAAVYQEETCKAHTPFIEGGTQHIPCLVL